MKARRNKKIPANHRSEAATPAAPQWPWQQIAARAAELRRERNLFSVRKRARDRRNTAATHPTEAMRALHDALRSAIARMAGVFLVTGGAGTGKSVFAARLAAELKAAGHLVIERECSNLALGVLTRKLAAHWRREAASSALRTAPPVLLVDTAELLPLPALRAMQDWLAREAANRADMRVVLVGRPSLEKRLDQPALDGLRQRLRFRGRVEPLGADDIRPFLRHLSPVSDGTQAISDETLAALLRHTEGRAANVKSLWERARALARQSGAPAPQPAHVQLAARQFAPEPGETGAAADDAAARGWKVPSSTALHDAWRRIATSISVLAARFCSAASRSRPACGAPLDLARSAFRQTGAATARICRAATSALAAFGAALSDTAAGFARAASRAAGRRCGTIGAIFSERIRVATALAGKAARFRAVPRHISQRTTAPISIFLSLAAGLGARAESGAIALRARLARAIGRSSVAARHVAQRSRAGVAAARFALPSLALSAVAAIIIVCSSTPLRDIGGISATREPNPRAAPSRIAPTARPERAAPAPALQLRARPFAGDEAPAAAPQLPPPPSASIPAGPPHHAASSHESSRQMVAAEAAQAPPPLKPAAPSRRFAHRSAPTLADEAPRDRTSARRPTIAAETRRKFARRAASGLARADLPAIGVGASDKQLAALMPSPAPSPRCQPYRSDLDFAGRSASVEGIACRDAQGHWWLMSQQRE